ncbi:MAG: beta-N-acetylhexosaminidase [Alloprevotella sp.]|nr:beta-N-acetylhexosaminidase [Alloprevotella sp.]
MIRNIYLLLLACCLLPTAATAQDFLNLTPKPYQATTVKGTLPLPGAFSIALNGVADSIRTEAGRFAAAFAEEAGCEITLTEGGGGFCVLDYAADCAAEEYRLDVDGQGISLKARTTAGFFYGFQTLRKLLRTDGTLPYASLRDLPRFPYRGFMLDVSRHFFDAAEVKKLIDLMSRYKLNRFHWHLSDDQGWRVEIEKYPKLTTVGATADNCYVTDMTYGPYWTNRQYGPHFYTKEEIRDVVAYAKERHVEIIPEIDMPGHFVAVLCAYPEFSCTPNASRSVWTSGGISADVLNVADPKAVQFCKDVLEELMELFPYEQVNIGGDECPTSAWEGNALCQERYRKLGLTNYRQLQSHFIKEMADFIAAHGKKTSVWNEAITAGGADTELVKQAGVTVYCWTGAEAAARKAAALGLDNIFTPWGPYYINRKQSTRADEPSAAGDGTDNLRKTYTTVPVPTDITAAQEKHYTGVQGTFWCEHVADTAYLEYLALPRLLAIAEAGWTQQEAKDYDDFVERVTADTALLDRLGFGYCRHDLNVQEADMPKVMPEPGAYYRIVTRATDDSRKGRCLELLTAASPLTATYAGNGAAANMLWTNVQATAGAGNYDYQFWTFEESPTEPGKYAIVCKAVPDGSVNPVPTAQSNTGRWKYDAAKKNYNFLLGEAAYGKDGTDYYYTMRSDRTTGWYVNASMPGQGLAANLWTEPLSGNGGLWTFAGTAQPEPEPIVAEPVFEAGKAYRIINAVEGYEDLCLADTEDDNYLRFAPASDDRTVWTATAVETNADGTQSAALQNRQSKRFIYTNATQAKGQTGWPVRMSKTQAMVKVRRNAGTEDITLSLHDRNFFPLMPDAPVLPGAISSGTTISGQTQAVRPQGAAWRAEEVKADGIRDVRTDTPAHGTPGYDLQGRRVAEDTAGISIIGGRKVLR